MMLMLAITQHADLLGNKGFVLQLAGCFADPQGFYPTTKNNHL
jgi:hypothetical protein